MSEWDEIERRRKETRREAFDRLNRGEIDNAEYARLIAKADGDAKRDHESGRD